MSEIKIKVKQTNGQKLTKTLSVMSDMQIDEFRKKIKEEFNVEESKQNLIFKGRILKEGKSLSEYNIKNDDLILLVERITAPPSNNQSNILNIPSNISSGHGAPGQINYDLLNQNLGTNMNFDQIERMLENPMVQSQMQDMLSDPNVLNTMMNNPMIKPLLDNNPMLRSLFSNPEFMRNMMRPEVLRQFRDMRQNFGNDLGGLGMGMGNPLLNNYMNMF